MATSGHTHNERVLALLSDRKPHTHHELYALGVIAHSRIAALRGKGYTIQQHREGDAYVYQLTGVPLLEEAHIDPAAVCASSSGADNPSRHTSPPPSWGEQGDKAVCAAQLCMFEVAA